MVDRARKRTTEPALLPVEGAWVARRGRPEIIGIVAGHEGGGIHVDFIGNGGRTFLKPGEWVSGLRSGFTVQDVPLSAARQPLGTGTVRAARTLCGRDQALVQSHQDGKSRWLPFERLRPVMDPAASFVRAAQHDDRPAERTALNVMAHALRIWNEATGALDRLDVDPLPHQISLVHRIVTSGQANWLIADDVGLGKTIEVGLLLAALERRQALRRILIVTPAGLTRQWQDEMSFKFDRRFLILGRDFAVNDAQDWPRFERVIVSLDLAKPQTGEDDGTDETTRFGMLLAAGSWDAVVFDEAHRLSKAESGQTTLRFRLAEALRKRTDAMILLSGTPHQGDAARFRNLLTLVRPDLAEAIDMLEFQPEVVRDIILRNRKIDAVNADGEFIFRGALVRRVEVPMSGEIAALERLLRDYLSRGYAAGSRMGGSQGRAIGFVMTIYRKLASSSIFALIVALKKRRARLLAEAAAMAPGRAEEGEEDDLLAQPGAADRTTPFFENEAAQLDRVIAHAKSCLPNDPKRRMLKEAVEDLVVRGGRKLLIFSEYRQTQAYLELVLTALGLRTALIHGGQTLDEKRGAIERFEDDAAVLVSTEAGGEGLNLHRRCHVMINYDLPWNPSKLTQRIGRLYRYGQKEQVVVLNLHARDTIDNEILSNVVDRLDAVVRAMSPVNAEFDSRYHSEVMGELLERLEIDDLLEEAARGRIDRSAERIDAAIASARSAKRIQDEILSGASAHDPASWQELGALSTAHLAAFVRRAAPFLGIGVEGGQADAEQFTLRLPAELRGRFAEFGGRLVVSATTKRGTGRARDAVLLDFANGFVRHLVERVTAPEFAGGYGVLQDEAFEPATCGLFLARFQNDQGRAQGEELVVVAEDRAGNLETDRSAVLPLFGAVQNTGRPGAADAATRKALAEALRERAAAAMAGSCNRFQHPNDLICLAVLESRPPA